VCFAHAYHLPTGAGLRVFRAVFHVLGFYFLSLIPSLFLVGWLIESLLPSDVSGGAAILVLGALAPLIPIVVSTAEPPASRLGRAVYVIKKLVSGETKTETDVRARELVADHSGLTIRGTLVRTHLPWRDIAQIGVLQPERGALNHRLSGIQYTRTDVLVVRLRPEIPAPSVVSVLSDEHRQLGYLGLCAMEELGSSRQEMISALERFAGGKLVHNSRQFLDRDPRLRPEMV
jgi:hypothetical protein